MNDNDICEVGEKCDGARAVHTHHRKLRSQGGGDEPSNLLRTCAACHLFIHENPSEAYARGLLVHSWADPALVEVFGAQAKLEALWAEQNSRSSFVVKDRDENQLTPGETCIVCKRRVPHPKKPTSPTTKVWSTRVPVADAETFSELVDAAAEHHGISDKPHHRYWTMLYALTLLLQAEKGELPA